MIFPEKTECSEFTGSKHRLEMEVFQQQLETL
jgi:hypothetical protein